MSIPRTQDECKPRSWFDDLHAIRDLPISRPGVKHLLLCLYTFCRQDECWPSHDTLAACMGLDDDRNARRRIAEAQEMGLLQIEKRLRTDGTTASNRYIINFAEVYRLYESGATPPVSEWTDAPPVGGACARGRGAHAPPLELSSRTVQCLSSKTHQTHDLTTGQMPDTVEPPGWWDAAKAALNKWSNSSRRHPMVAARNETQSVRDRLFVALSAETVVFGDRPTPALLMIPRAVEVLVNNGVSFKSAAFVCGCVVSTIKEFQTHGVSTNKPARKSAVDERRAARSAKEFAEDIDIPLI